MTVTLSSTFGGSLGGVTGAVITAWKHTRFTTPPIQGHAPPGGSPDGGPVTTATTFGSRGGWRMTVATDVDYWISAEFNTVRYWSLYTGAGTGTTKVSQIIAGTGIAVTPTTGEGIVTVTNAGVDQLIAGTNITLSPSTGKGDVTVNAAGATPDCWLKAGTAKTGPTHHANGFNTWTVKWTSHTSGGTRPPTFGVTKVTVTINASGLYVVAVALNFSITFPATVEGTASVKISLTLNTTILPATATAGQMWHASAKNSLLGDRIVYFPFICHYTTGDKVKVYANGTGAGCHYTSNGLTSRLLVRRIA